MLKLPLLGAIGLAMAWTLPVVTAHAESDAAALQRANRMAYDAAIKCFVAASVATGEREDAGDRDAATRYEHSARKSFDTASALGEKLGFSGSRINQDFGMAQAAQLPKLVRDLNYYRDTAAMCRALGLM